MPSCRRRRKAVRPGVVRKRRIDKPAADERQNAIGHSDISFAGRERTVQHDRADERINHRTPIRRYRPGADENAVADVAMVVGRCGKRRCG